MNNTAPSKKPEYSVYTKSIQLDGTSSVGLQIGVAWAHQKGEGGFNIILDAVPVGFNGKAELVVFKNKENKG